MNQPTREKITLELPVSKLSIEYYGYITAREMLGVSKSDDALKEMIERLVVSLDGSQENIYERVLDLRLEDYKALDEALLSLVKTNTDANSKKD